MATKEGKVRLTQQAHILCSEKAEEYKTSMKAVASEAIFLMFSKEKAQEDCKGLIEEGKKGVEKKFLILIEGQKRDDRRYSLGAFALGSIAGVALIFFVGMVV